jgi:prophage DNA circulation protein
VALILGQLYPALYKGVSFLLQSHTLTAGRKTVTHEFPNSDYRVVEDLGALPDKFTITGITTGGNYMQVRDNLIAALNSQGPGQLVHPFYGTIMVTATTYTVQESTVQLNAAIFSMNFERSIANVYPAFSGQNTSLINQLAIAIATLLNTDIGQFIVSPGYPQNFKDAVNILNGMYAIFEGIQVPFSYVINSVGLYDEAVNAFGNSVNQLVSQPTVMSDDIQNIFYLSDQLTNDQPSKLAIALQFFGTNLNEPPIEPTTVQRIERINNRYLLNMGMNLYSLLNGYNAFAKITYERYDILNTDFNNLENQYQFLINNYSPTGDTLDLLKDLRVQIRKVYDTQKTNVRYLVPIFVQPQPMRVLCYLLYGNTTDVDSLIAINNITNPAQVSGDLLVFSE